eukprot:CAMPEP_0115534632 /NCGR_PEP_ID=MMETSP0271-20121206/86780_1 /TAXON_ID=71861 /ORGANISM="Scrippsiella trochoidea, Strain CCMP3099" /LENGTH=62 /DNA_ID=CAMNT_0002967137 /DNA_START=97 /DNA_END=281 /DNA_ORIENTATION=-
MAAQRWGVPKHPQFMVCTWALKQPGGLADGLHAVCSGQQASATMHAACAGPSSDTSALRMMT